MHFEVALPSVLGARTAAAGVIGVAAPDSTAVAMKIVGGSPRAMTLLDLGTVGMDVSGAAELSRVPVRGDRVVGAVGIGADLDAALRGGTAER